MSTFNLDFYFRAQTSPPTHPIAQIVVTNIESRAKNTPFSVASLRVQFGRHLRRLRLARDMTQEQFAEAASVSVDFLIREAASVSVDFLSLIEREVPSARIIPCAGISGPCAGTLEADANAQEHSHPLLARLIRQNPAN
jgi:helix-turn-helix protein